VLAYKNHSFYPVISGYRVLENYFLAVLQLKFSRNCLIHINLDNKQLDALNLQDFLERVTSP